MKTKTKQTMPKMQKIFSEYGLDFDNNKYGFGHSTEIEYDDDSEKRTREHIKIKYIQARYLRIWIGKIVMVIDSDKPHFGVHKKKHWNFKIVYGKSGIV